MFGQITAWIGFRRLYNRGQQNVRREWNLVPTAFNLRKIAISLQIPPRQDGTPTKEPTTRAKGTNNQPSKPRAFSLPFLTSGWDGALATPLVRSARPRATTNRSCS